MNEVTRTGLDTELFGSLLAGRCEADRELLTDADRAQRKHFAAYYNKPYQGD